MEEKEKDTVEVVESVTDGKKKKGKKAKKIIIAIVSLLLVVAIGFCGYFYIQNEKRYEEYINTARTYIRKVESSYDVLEVLNIKKNASLYGIVLGKGGDAADAIGWNTAEAKAIEEIRNETSKLGYKLRNPDKIYFHENVDEIRKLVKLVDEDFVKSSSLVGTGNLYNIMTDYSKNIDNVKSGIRKLKLLLY